MPPLLKLDFGADSARTARGMIVLVAALSAAALIVLGHFGLQWAQRDIETQLLETTRALRASPVAPPLSAVKARVLRNQAESSHRVLATLERPWHALLADIEAAAGGDIGLAAFEAEARQGNVRITGEAKDLDALGRYLERLVAGSSLSDVRLAHHELREGSHALAVRFVVFARWSGGS